MKKLTSLLIASTMLLSLASCGNNNNSSDTSKTDSSSAEETTAPTEKESETEEETEEKTEPEKDTEPEDDTETEDSDKEESGEVIDINDYITVENPEPALWKATDPDTGNELYLLGTIHVVSENKFKMPEYLLDVYENCDGVAVEYDVRELEKLDVAQELIMKMLYTDGTMISDHISEEAYEAGKKCLSDLGMYSSILDVYVPGFWLSQIESMAIMTFENLSENGVDSQFIELAAKDGKEIISIETLDIQATAMSCYSDDYVDYCLRQLPEDMENLEETAEALGELYDLWATGDMDEMDAINNDTEDIPEDLLDDVEEYNKIMLYDRNKGMADKAAEFLENGNNYFFMVGALHFAGDKGVDDLLEDKGYTIERIK